jgi:hypothetical protein
VSGDATWPPSPTLAEAVSEPFTDDGGRVWAARVQRGPVKVGSGGRLRGVTFYPQDGGDAIRGWLGGDDPATEELLVRALAEGVRKGWVGEKHYDFDWPADYKPKR